MRRAVTGETPRGVRRIRFNADPQAMAAGAVEPLLLDLLQQDGVCFASAYHETRKTQPVAAETLGAYGRLLFEADPDWSGQIACVHPGLIGFTRIAEAERLFPLILSVARRYAALAPAQPGGVQACASYVAQKVGHGQTAFLNRYAQVPNHNQPDPEPRHFSLVHFSQAANAPRKLDMMRRYAATPRRYANAARRPPRR